MLLLSPELAEAIVQHALAEHPIEACGLMAGAAGGPPTRHIRLRNASHAPDAFSLDSREQLAVWRALEACGEVPQVLYHSHTASRAYPSRADVAFAGDPALHYLIVSTRDRQCPELRSFRISAGGITEESLVISHATRR